MPWTLKDRFDYGTSESVKSGTQEMKRALFGLGLSVFLWVAADAGAANIDILNASFESPQLSCDGTAANCTEAGNVTSWMTDRDQQQRGMEH